jgi:hypothetical protein
VLLLNSVKLSQENFLKANGKSLQTSKLPFWTTKKQKKSRKKRKIKMIFVYDCCMQTRHLSSRILQKEMRRGRMKQKSIKMPSIPVSYSKGKAVVRADFIFLVD